MRQSSRATACDNLNHRRAQPSIRHCPTCGDAVNADVRVRQCSESEHAAERRHGSPFCADCGAQLTFNN